MLGKGYKNVRALLGGWNSWVTSGGERVPSEANDNRPSPPLTAAAAAPAVVTVEAPVTAQSNPTERRVKRPEVIITTAPNPIRKPVRRKVRRKSSKTHRS